MADKILVKNNKALLVDGDAIKYSGGGSAGYKLTLYHTCISEDSGYIQINGTDTIKLTNYIDSHYFSSMICENVTTFKVYNFDHRGTYPSTSSSWARYRVSGSSTWTNINLYTAPTITLTADAELQVLESTCLNKGTLISMYDGTKKKIEDIIVGDIVKNYKGEPATVYKDEHNNQAFADDRDIWKFESDYEIITTYRHRFYNIEHQKMMYLNEWQIGEHAYSEDGKQVALLEHIHEDTPCHYYSLWCENGNNYFAGGLLAGNRFTEEINIDIGV